MVLFRNRMHMQRAILLVLLNSSAAANASVNNLPSIILLVHKIALRGVNECTESENHLPPQSAALGNRLHSTSSKCSVIINCSFSFQLALCNNAPYPITLHTSQVSQGIPESAPSLLQVLLLTSAPPAAGEVLTMRYTTVICISSHLRSYTSSAKTRTKSNHYHKNTKYTADFFILTKHFNPLLQ